MTARPLAAVLSLLTLSGCTGSLIDAGSRLVIQGSDTEVQMVAALAEEFGKTSTGSSVSVTGGGSAVGIAALINGGADIANSSRAMTEEERTQARAKGLTVQEFTLARDGLAVIVHPGNPVKTLSVEQVGKIYAGAIANWKDVGGPDAPIVLYGRQSTSGTFGFFRDVVVKDDYAPTMRQMEGSQAIVDGVAGDRNGIGYAGIGYVKPAASAQQIVYALSISDTGKPAASQLERESVLSGRYPISRPIYQYLGAVPEKGSIVEEFLSFEASAAGIAVIEASGFYPPTAEDSRRNAALFAAMK